jgi:hypothetical protein
MGYFSGKDLNVRPANSTNRPEVNTVHCAKCALRRLIITASGLTSALALKITSIFLVS